MTDPLDPEEGSDSDYPYCEALNGLGPHNYQPYLDILKGGTYLYCNQCGDIIEMLDPPAQPPAGSAVAPTATPAVAPSSSKPSWP